MKQQITTYFREYYNNFKQKPLQGSAVLAMQILFLLGWGMLYTYLYRLYTSFIIPGITEPKGNIYADTAYTLILTIIYSYCFYKLSKILFSVRSNIKVKLLEMLGAGFCALAILPLFITIHYLFSFLPETYIAFWAN